MKDKPRNKKPAWHNLSRVEKAAYKRRHLISESTSLDNNRQERRAAHDRLIASANVHLGNKLLKPGDYYNPNGKMKGSGGSIKGHQINRYRKHSIVD